MHRGWATVEVMVFFGYLIYNQAERNDSLRYHCLRKLKKKKTQTHQNRDQYVTRLESKKKKLCIRIPSMFNVSIELLPILNRFEIFYQKKPFLMASGVIMGKYKKKKPLFMS